MIIRDKPQIVKMVYGIASELCIYIYISIYIYIYIIHHKYHKHEQPITIMTSKSSESSQPFQRHRSKNRSHPITSLAMSRSAAQQIKRSGNSPLEISSTFDGASDELEPCSTMTELFHLFKKKMGPYEATFFDNSLLWDNKP